MSKHQHTAAADAASATLYFHPMSQVPDSAFPPGFTRWRVGCVSYLNSKPLIHRLDTEHADRLTLRLAVPADLLGLLEAGEVDLALCPVIDSFRSTMPGGVALVPVGGIACEGPTLTVRLFSRVPLDQLTQVHADTDSHTSVTLLRVLLDALYDRRPALVDHSPGSVLDAAHLPEALLLIGDKVITASPPAAAYPFQLDLGEAWHQMTGQPFVFAVWMASRDKPLGDLPALLASQRENNLLRLPEIVERYAAAHGWPAPLAADYLGQILRYRIGPRELAAVSTFARLAAALDLIPKERVEPVLHPDVPL